MTKLVFQNDAFLKSLTATVTGHTAEGGLVLDQTIFYPQGGGQPGDSGRVEWGSSTLPIAMTVKGEGDDVVFIPGAPQEMPPVGAVVTQFLDWSRRHRFMRVHTALHLLSVAVPFPVTGGAIAAEKGRLDFKLSGGSVDKDALELALNELVDRDLPVTEDWITDAQLRANPGLVKTMSVMPPMGQGRVRLVRIGQGDDQIDLQPCGGTHVARTSEIGRLRVGKVENKGRENRRVNILID